MGKTMLHLDEFRLALAHVEKLLDRRQTTTSFYLSVNTGVFAAIGLLLRDVSLLERWVVGSVLLLLCAGLIACFIWRSLLRQYEILLDWWYSHLRELEASIPDSAQLITQEYQDLYAAATGDHKPAQRIGMTKREVALNWVFTALYTAFAIGIVLDVLL